WEFPGGKIQEGETAAEAARREAREEMGIEARDLELVETIDHDYPDRRVRLHVFMGEPVGDPATTDGAEWVWAMAEDLEELRIPAANRSLVQRMLDPDLRPSFSRFAR